MSNDFSKFSCSEIDCPVRSSGQCLEGLAISECSHFKLLDEDELVNTEDLVEKSISTVKLFSGDEIQIENLNFITHQYQTNIVTIIGESNSGKTTMLATIFDLFQIGNFKSLEFSGSLTQIGFEKRCHLSRFSSGALIPETAKTNSTNFSYLHLSYKFINSVQRATHLLLSDISGERFQTARDSSSGMEELKILRETDHIIFIIDGKKLADKFQKESVITNAQMFIRMALETRIFSKKTDLTIIVSKWDLLEKTPTFDFDENIVNYFNKEFVTKLNKIEFVKVAARPLKPTSSIPYGYGLENLLISWTKVKQNSLEMYDKGEESHTRYFNKYSFENAE